MICTGKKSKHVFYSICILHWSTEEGKIVSSKELDLLLSPVWNASVAQRFVQSGGTHQMLETPHNSLCRYLCHLPWSMEGTSASSEIPGNSICRNPIAKVWLQGSQRRNHSDPFYTRQVPCVCSVSALYSAWKCWFHLQCFLPTTASVSRIHRIIEIGKDLQGHPDPPLTSYCQVHH